MKKKPLDFLGLNHKSTKRDYLKRVLEVKKSEAAVKAKKWGFDYWDGSRTICYGGYHYDGRWEKIAKKFIKYYKLNNSSKILDVGCGKGFLVYELKKLLPGAEILGIDISKYALRKGKKALTINEGDEIIGSYVLGGDDTVLLFTQNGKSIHFHEWTCEFIKNSFSISS